MNSSHFDVWLMIGLVGIGSFITRASFFWMASRVTTVPESTRVWLRMVPPSAFAALVAPALFVADGTFNLVSPDVIAGVLAAAVAWKTRNIALTIVVGLGMFVLLGQIPMHA